MGATPHTSPTLCLSILRRFFTASSLERDGFFTQRWHLELSPEEQRHGFNTTNLRVLQRGQYTSSVRRLHDAR